jgi:hypothetical protein
MHAFLFSMHALYALLLAAMSTLEYLLYVLRYVYMCMPMVCTFSSCVMLSNQCIHHMQTLTAIYLLPGV